MSECCLSNWNGNRCQNSNSIELVTSHKMSHTKLSRYIIFQVVLPVSKRRTLFVTVSQFNVLFQNISVLRVKRILTLLSWKVFVEWSFTYYISSLNVKFLVCLRRTFLNTFFLEAKTTENTTFDVAWISCQSYKML